MQAGRDNRRWGTVEGLVERVEGLARSVSAHPVPTAMEVHPYPELVPSEDDRSPINTMIQQEVQVNLVNRRLQQRDLLGREAALGGGGLRSV